MAITQEQTMGYRPLVTIIINNYNYEKFIGETIQSALNQTYQLIEVIVVDDGSTDRSSEVIASFKDRIMPVLKPNGGQASAMNAGFTVANGEIIMFLDSDDVLLPDTIERVVAAFQSMPNVAKVQYRLQTIDQNSKLTGEIIPAKRWAMPTGDLRQKALKSSSYISPPTSGTVFSAAALRHILPIPEKTFRISADMYLNGLSVLLGPIVSLDEVGAYYRVHGKNNIGNVRSAVDLVDMRNFLAKVDAIHIKSKEIVNQLYPELIYDPEQDHGASLTARIISLKLDSANHPYPKDNLISLCTRGFLHALTTSQPRKHVSVLTAFWHLAMLLAPKQTAKSLADNLIYAESRGLLINKLRRVIQMIG